MNFRRGEAFSLIRQNHSLGLAGQCGMRFSLSGKCHGEHNERCKQSAKALSAKRFN